jgi:hypothetical protein
LICRITGGTWIGKFHAHSISQVSGAIEHADSSIIIFHFSQTARDNFSLIAEVGTVQLEFMTLSHHTGDPQYARKVKYLPLVIDLFCCMRTPR